MSDNRWQGVEEIFNRAVDLAPESRSAFLDEACGKDQSLRREVESLLAHESEDGTTFAGDDVPRVIAHFRITGKLGQGGMGVVYRAQDLKLDRLVALKFLPRHPSADPQQKQRLIQEAKAACVLDHANIGVVHDIDETADGRMFIVMAYYDGETLAQRIERGISTQEAINIAIRF
jgi:serine/threonine protein kinase